MLNDITIVVGVTFDFYRFINKTLFFNFDTIVIFIHINVFRKND